MFNEKAGARIRTRLRRIRAKRRMEPGSTSDALSMLVNRDRRCNGRRRRYIYHSRRRRCRRRRHRGFREQRVRARQCFRNRFGNAAKSRITSGRTNSEDKRVPYYKEETEPKKVRLRGAFLPNMHFDGDLKRNELGAKSYLWFLAFVLQNGVR